jgi:hypothetical protein
VQGAKVFLVGRRRILGDQDVISDSKYTRRKQLLPIPVLSKRPRLPHQPVDHVAVVDPLLVPATQPRQPLDQLLRIPHLHVLGIQPGLDVLADQSARYGVAVSLDVNQATAVHATAPPLARFKPSRRQRPQYGQLLSQSVTPTGIELLLDAVQKPRVLFAAGKISTIAHQQRLRHRLFEAPVPLLDVAVLMRVVGLDLLTDHPVVIQQRLISPRELLPLEGAKRCTR